MLYTPDWDSLNTRPTPAWFQRAKFGIFIHWGLYSIPAWAPKGYYAEWYWQWVGAPIPKGISEKERLMRLEAKAHHKAHFSCAYEDFADQWDISGWQPEQWAELFAKAQARYVIPVAKHHDGFCLWNSPQASATYHRPWNSVQAAPRRDIIGDLGQSVRAKGLDYGVYYSLMEWFSPVWQEKGREQYVEEVMIPQIYDLIDSYDPQVLWTDGEWLANDREWRAPEILAWLFNHEKVGQTIAVNDRWSSGDRSHIQAGYLTTEYGAGLANGQRAWEQCRGMGTSFGINTNESVATYRSARELVLLLIDCVSRGGNFLLNVAPEASGRIPEAQKNILLEMGAWLEENGEGIFDTQPYEKSCQWSEGNRNEEAYERQSAMEAIAEDYEASQNLGLGPNSQGKARKEVLFTHKGDCVYAFFAQWPTSAFIVKGMDFQEAFVLDARCTLPVRQVAGGMCIDCHALPKQPQIARVLRLSKKRQ